jgi:hypothetical protein
MKIISIVLLAGVTIHAGGCVSAYSPRKHPLIADDSRIHLTFRVSKGVVYQLVASRKDGEPIMTDARLSGKKGNWAPVAGRIVVSQRNGEIHQEYLSFVKPDQTYEQTQWRICRFEAQASGNVEIVISGKVSFLNKDRTWRLYHALK